jgi:carboxymethylenebutenolidase
MAALAPGPHRAAAERITLTGVDGAAVPAILARPDDVEPVAGIALHPDVMGVRPLFDDACRRLASHGYAVCCPEPFARAPDDVRAAGPPARLGFLPSLDDDLQLGDLAAAADRAGAPSAAATGRFQRAVPFYGMIRPPGAWRGPRQRAPLDTAAGVCPTLAIFGGADSYTPPADLDDLRAAWRDRPDCEVVVYPEAEHGFVHDPERPAHRPDDAADAWARALAFLAPLSRRGR